MSIHALHDDHGRTVRYLRLSLTDRCNLRCLYCHSNARHQCIPHEKVLRYEEMIRLVQIVRGMGVGKVRLTGGEPFARKGCDDFLLRLRQCFDDLDIRITTNGTLLEEHIPLLQRIRISAVNLSLDSFDRETFARVTGRDMLPEVLRALDAMLAAGIRVKINAVGLRGINDGQLADFVHAAMTLPVDVRFIEFMPMGSDTLWSPENFWPASDIRAAVEQHVRLVPLGDANEGQRGPHVRPGRRQGAHGLHHAADQPFLPVLQPPASDQRRASAHLSVCRQGVSVAAPAASSQGHG